MKEVRENPECPEKWRTLSMTPLTSDPVVLQLQRSLASATLENDQLQNKLNKVCLKYQSVPFFFFLA